MVHRVVVVGASLAGLRAAETLRSEGFDGEIVMIGAEAHLPYDRPPLSKRFLAGEVDAERIALRKPDAIDELALAWRLGVRATALDLDRRVVRCDDGEDASFDALVIATGGTPRWPSAWPHLPATTALRTIDDAQRIKAVLDASPTRVCVIGAGFIGAEVAATARKAGVDVTIVEALPVPLVRGLGEQMGGAVSALHRDHDVDLRVGVGVASVEGGAVDGATVTLDDDTRIDADLVVVGIGVSPETAWLEGSGLELRDGVVCDATLACANAAGVFAAGDVARWPNGLYGEEMRVEHWTNAAEQGQLAAMNVLAHATGADPKPYEPVPFFWSDQYDAKIQFVGRGSSDDEVRVVHGSVDERRFVALYGRNGKLRGALGVSLPKLLMPYRRLLSAGASWDDAVNHAHAVEESTTQAR
jgi:NADPH-dependent 2,4-dienoyl-CoA reductase/sulfur reductase-like enzyme